MEEIRKKAAFDNIHMELSPHRLQELSKSGIPSQQIAPFEIGDNERFTHIALSNTFTESIRQRTNLERYMNASIIERLNHLEMLYRLKLLFHYWKIRNLQEA